MKKRILLFAAFIALSITGQPVEPADKTMEYFWNRYGAVVKHADTNIAGLWSSPSLLSRITVHGSFTTRQYHSGAMTVDATFERTGGLLLVRFTLPSTWNAEQITAALAAYGNNWIPIRSNGTTVGWSTDTGSIAFPMPFGSANELNVQTPAGTKLAKSAHDEQERKAKVIPKF